MEGIECDNAAFNTLSRESIDTRNCSFKKLPNSASKVANWIIEDIVKYLY